MGAFPAAPNTGEFPTCEGCLAEAASGLPTEAACVARVRRRSERALSGGGQSLHRSLPNIAKTATPPGELRKTSPNGRGMPSALCRAMCDAEKKFVYILRSDVNPSRHYVGVTSDVRRRLEKHNHAPNGYTVHSRPWSLVVSMEFGPQAAALNFEKYLKSGSGRAFANRHFGDV